METPPVTATAADGTHPTGMHSCLFENLVKSYVGAPTTGNLGYAPAYYKRSVSYA